MAEAEMAQGWGGWGWDGNFSCLLEEQVEKLAGSVLIEMTH